MESRLPPVNELESLDFGESEHVHPLLRNALASLKDDTDGSGRKKLQEMLESKLDPLQRLGFYDDALRLMENNHPIIKSWSPSERDKVKSAYQDMVDELWAAHASTLRPAVQHLNDWRQTVKAIVGTPADLPKPASGRELQAMVFDPIKRFDENHVLVPINGRALLEQMIRTAGPQAVMKILPTRRRASARGLRTGSAAGKTSRYADRDPACHWLSTKDMEAFAQVQSVMESASALHRDMVNLTKRAAPMHESEMALLFFTAAERGWGKSKAGELVEKIAGDVKSKEDLSKIYRMIGATVEKKLPSSLWPQEKSEAQEELINSLRDRALELDSPSAQQDPSEEEKRRKQEWRDDIVNTKPIRARL